MGSKDHQNSLDDAANAWWVELARRLFPKGTNLSIEATELELELELN